MRQLAALSVALLAACTSRSEKVDSTTAPAAVAAPSAAAPSAAAVKADEDSIRAISGRIAAVMSSRDTAAIAALYADDGVDFTPYTPPARGRPALAKEYDGLFRSLKDVKMSVGPADVTVAQSGDLAVSRAPYEMSYTDAKGKPGKEHGNVVVAWKKVSGAWKIATSMNAPDTPAPGM